MTTIKINRTVRPNDQHTIEIEGFGTITAQSLNQQIYNAGNIYKSYAFYNKNRSNLLTTEIYFNFINNNSDLFPKNF